MVVVSEGSHGQSALNRVDVLQREVGNLELAVVEVTGRIERDLEGLRKCAQIGFTERGGCCWSARCQC